MIVSIYDRSADYGRVNVTFWVIIVVMILKIGQYLFIFDFVDSIVPLWDYTLMKEYSCVLMTIANKTLVLLTKFPFFRCINLKVPFFWIRIMVRVLIPNEFRIVDFPGENKRIWLTILILMEFQCLLILLDQVVSFCI